MSPATTEIDSLRVIWPEGPAGLEQAVAGAEIDRLLVVVQDP